MDRVAAMLALVTGGMVMPVLVHPGEAPCPGAPAGAPFSSVEEIVDGLRSAWSRAGRPPLVGAAVAVENGASSVRSGVLEAGGAVPVEASAIMRALETSRVHVLDVRAAAALGAPRMSDEDRILYCSGVPQADATVGIVAPETELAVTFAVRDHWGDWVAVMSEAHRLSLTPECEREAAVLQVLDSQGLHSAGAVLCRTGFAALHAAIEALEGKQAVKPLDPVVVCELAKSGHAPALEAASLFSGWLGAVSRHAAMIMAAQGGMYLSGPLLRTMGEAFDIPRFESRFRPPEGRDHYLDRTPVWRAASPASLLGLSTLFSASDARMNASGVLLLDC